MGRAAPERPFRSSGDQTGARARFADGVARPGQDQAVVETPGVAVAAAVVVAEAVVVVDAPGVAVVGEAEAVLAAAPASDELAST